MDHHKTQQKTVARGSPECIEYMMATIQILRSDLNDAFEKLKGMQELVSLYEHMAFKIEK